MKQLSKLNCEPCRADARPLAPREIELLLPDVPGWECVTESRIHKLRRVFQVKCYAQSMSFAHAVAELAESENHHPVLIVEYSAVTVLWWSHHIKGLQMNDFIMAAKTSALF